MADDTEEDFDGDAGDAGAGQKKGKKKLLFIILPVLLLVGGGAGAYFSGLADSLLGGGEETHDAATGEDGGDHAEGATAKVGEFFPLEEMVVNLKGRGRKQAYLKLRVTLELESAKDIPKLEKMQPRITDQFQTFLHELRIEDLDGGAGMARVREELLVRVNKVAKPIHVRRINFQEFVIQ
jgi:flagellar FliL protein